jgi:hypothetical protein
LKPKIERLSIKGPQNPTPLLINKTQNTSYRLRTPNKHTPLSYIGFQAQQLHKSVFGSRVRTGFRAQEVSFAQECRQALELKKELSFCSRASKSFAQKFPKAFELNK